MEKAQLWKRVHIIISCSNPYIFVIRERYLKYCGWTHFGRAKDKGHTMTHTFTPNQYPYQVSSFYTLWNQRNNPDKILKLMVTMTRSNQGHTITLHTYCPLTNAPTKYQFPTPYSCQDIAWTRFYRSRSIRQGQRSNQGHIMMLHTYTP